MKLTENFSLEEMTVSDIGARKGLDNTPNATEIANLIRTAALLEQLRAIIKKPIRVNSAFRSKAVNDAVGSKDTSQHRIGCAADIKVTGMSPREVVQACIDAKLPYDQVIEEFSSWTHISVPDMPSRPPRRQALTIDNAGTRLFK
jgi:hypothetical protein